MALRSIVLALLIVALARPQAGSGTESVLSEGIDIVLAVDVSGSMRDGGLQAEEQAGRREGGRRRLHPRPDQDRIGMVVFAADSFTQCPLTLDYNVLLGLLDSVDIGMIDERETAIGMAMATASNRLRESDTESKVVILLTDGRNNAGEIDPITAAQAAAALGIKVYTIGAGTPEGGMMPVDDPVWGRRYVHVHTDIDEDIAQGDRVAHGRAVLPGDYRGNARRHLQADR